LIQWMNKNQQQQRMMLSSIPNIQNKMDNEGIRRHVTKKKKKKKKNSNRILELFALSDGSGESIDQEGLGVRSALDGLLQEVDGDVAGHDLSVLHDVIQPLSSLGSITRGTTKQITSREVSKAELLNESRADGSLPSAGTTEHKHNVTIAVVVVLRCHRFHFTSLVVDC